MTTKELCAENERLRKALETIREKDESWRLYVDKMLDPEGLPLDRRDSNPRPRT